MTLNETLQWRLLKGEASASHDCQAPAVDVVAGGRLQIWRQVFFTRRRDDFAVGKFACHRPDTSINEKEYLPA